ncbi:hypothetical protein WMY93_034331, partial [Mugilogobius chulae]
MGHFSSKKRKELTASTRRNTSSGKNNLGDQQLEGIMAALELFEGVIRAEAQARLSLCGDSTQTKQREWILL